MQFFTLIYMCPNPNPVKNVINIVINHVINTKVNNREFLAQPYGPTGSSLISGWISQNSHDYTNKHI